MMRYSTILADPPWSFQVWSSTGHGRSAEHHYPTLPTEAIMTMPVSRLVTDDAALFMWATWPTLPDAIALGAAWGFEFKTCAFLWAKLNGSKGRQYSFDIAPPVEDDSHWHMGMGYWSRANTEPCLLFTRGKPKRKAADVRQLIVAPVGKHSQKPNEIYQRIERLVGGPYLELFARQKWAGWSCWGNQVPCMVDMYPMLTATA